MTSLARRISVPILDALDRKDRVRKLYSRYFSPDSWLRYTSGIVHVGANTGQEAAFYARFDLEVLWIEPIPQVYAQLVENISPFPKQRAYEALVTDRAAQTVTLNIASNGGAASSIYEFERCNEIWPEINYTGSLELESQTLADILERDGGQFDGLVMDTQGSELLVLKGAEARLSQFRYIKTEAANFEAYKGCTTVDEITAFLGPRGFRLLRQDVFATTPDGRGAYSDLVFKQR